jgi:GntR family transcriptional repressor for pyruvate dehydrogenase complex
MHEGDGLFTKVDHGKVAGEVVRQVETLVLEGVLRPGDRLPAERDLARILDISRPTLRQALAELEEKGLLEARHGGGTYVAQVMRSVFAEPIIGLFASHPRATGDYLEFRAEVEAVAARLAAERATPADKAILSRVIEAMHAAHELDDPAEEARLDVEFHIAIVDASHNIVLIQTLRSIYNLLVHGVFYNRTTLYRLPGGRQRLMGQHEAIFKAIMAADGAGASSAVHAHLDYVRQAMHDAECLDAREATALRRLQKFEPTDTTPGNARRRQTP